MGGVWGGSIPPPPRRLIKLGGKHEKSPLESPEKSIEK